MNKKIIGFIGSIKISEELIHDLNDNGYIIVSILDTVNEIYVALCKNNKDNKDDVLNKDIIMKSIRQRGYLLNKKFWINLTLSKIDKNKDKIIILDMMDEDRVNEVIKTYIVNSDNVNDIISKELLV